MSEAQQINPHEQVRVADQKVATIRAEIQMLTTERQRTREALAHAIVAWAGHSFVSDQQMRRDWIASQVAERQRLAQFGPDAATQPIPGNSAIDRSATYGAGGDASDFARKQMRSGYRRGSFPASQHGARLRRA